MPESKSDCSYWYEQYRVKKVISEYETLGVSRHQLYPKVGYALYHLVFAHHDAMTRAKLWNMLQNREDFPHVLVPPERRMDGWIEWELWKLRHMKEEA